MTKEIEKLRKIINHFFKLDRHIERIPEIKKPKTIEELAGDQSERAIFILKGAKFYLLTGTKLKNSSIDEKKQKCINYRKGKIIIGEYDLRSRKIKMESEILQISDFSVYEQDISTNSVYLIRTPQ